MANREQQSREKKEHIYCTAMQMFKHRGYAETTIRDICKAADISHSTFYHFFGDKSGILAEYFNGIIAQRNISLSQTEAHLAHPFQAIYDYMVTIAESQDLMGRDFVRETMYTNPKVYAARELTAVRYSGMQSITRFLEASQAAGYLSADLNCVDITEQLITLSSGILFNWITFCEAEGAASRMRRLLPRFFAVAANVQLEIKEF